jgi:hypothetical protein
MPACDRGSLIDIVQSAQSDSAANFRHGMSGPSGQPAVSVCSSEVKTPQNASLDAFMSNDPQLRISDDVNGPFRRDVNKSERSDAGTCNDAGNYSHQSRV